MRNSIPPNFANFAVGELFWNVQTTHMDLCLSVGGGRGTVSWAGRPRRQIRQASKGRDCGIMQVCEGGRVIEAER